MKQLINPIVEMSRKGQLTGMLLILCTLVSLSLSNSSFSESYFHLWHIKMGPSFFQLSVSHWINDGLMAVFFFLVGLEIRREVVQGELSDIRQSVLPVLAAIGGMSVPALFFISINLQNGHQQGWAIPTATDIAFSLGILSLLGKRVPFSLKVFLTALAIIDDLGAVLIIAIFYTQQIHVDQLLYALGVIILLLTMNRLKVRPLVFYLLPGLLLWWFIVHSGVHATIAGVLLALCVPMSKVEQLEHALQKPVNFFILPVFALANTAISIVANEVAVLLQPLSLGIIAGLFLGKPIGIVLMSWMAVKAGWTNLPAGVSWPKMVAAGCMAGIGFTMSIFIANLAFTEGSLLDESKLAILLGSLFSGIAGILFMISEKQQAVSVEDES